MLQLPSRTEAGFETGEAAGTLPLTPINVLVAENVRQQLSNDLPSATLDLSRQDIYDDLEKIGIGSDAEPYSRRNAAAVFRNSGHLSPITGPWPLLGIIQRLECGIAFAISTEISTGYKGSRSP